MLVEPEVELELALELALELEPVLEQPPLPLSWLALRVTLWLSWKVEAVPLRVAMLQALCGAAFVASVKPSEMAAACTAALG